MKKPLKLKDLEVKELKVGEEVLTLHHYKEPLLKIPAEIGHGFYGCLLSTKDGEKVQCHVCGKLVAGLWGHIITAHKLKAENYKESYGLNTQTSLLSENLRQDRKDKTLAWLKSMSKKDKDAYHERNRSRLKEYWKKVRKGEIKRKPALLKLERHNIRGTCPAQILDKIKEVQKKIGHTPSMADFINEIGSRRYMWIIQKVYGSWSNALKMAKLDPKPYTHGERMRYTDEQLLEHLSIFAQENKKMPTGTDGRRGLIPGENTYRNRFGSLEKARKLAGVYKHIE